MGCASICSFGSYLDESTSKFFTNREHPLIKKCSNVGFLDKILKAADPVFDFAEVVARAGDASDDTVNGIVKGRNFVKTGRDVTAFFNIFNGIIPSLIQSVKNVCVLLEGLFAKTATPLKEGPAERLSYNETAETIWEKLAALGEQTGKVISSGSFVAGFGICRPIGAFEKYISRDIDSGASKIGKAFPTVMMVNHIGGVLSGSCGLIFQKLAYDREVSVGDANRTVNAAVVYSKKTFEIGMGLAQKGLELISDIFHHTSTALPAYARIPLSCAIGGLSVANAWIKD